MLREETDYGYFLVGSSVATSDASAKSAGHTALYYNMINSSVVVIVGSSTRLSRTTLAHERAACELVRVGLACNVEWRCSWLSASLGDLPSTPGRGRKGGGGSEGRGVTTCSANAKRLTALPTLRTRGKGVVAGQLCCRRGGKGRQVQGWWQVVAPLCWRRGPHTTAGADDEARQCCTAGGGGGG